MAREETPLFIKYELQNMKFQKLLATILPSQCSSRGMIWMLLRTEETMERSWVFQEIVEPLKPSLLLTFQLSKMLNSLIYLGFMTYHQRHTNTGKHSSHFTDEETKAQRD